MILNYIWLMIFPVPAATNWPPHSIDISNNEGGQFKSAQTGQFGRRIQAVI